MKTLACILSILLAMNFVQAQNYQIGFTGSGQSSVVESIYVENLTQGTSLTIGGNDILHLVESVGINPMNNTETGLKISPNPMIESSILEFSLLRQGLATIEICNETGGQVATASIAVQAGIQKLGISGLASGVYTIAVYTTDMKLSSKLISLAKHEGNIAIRHLETIAVKASDDPFKNSGSIIQMQYNNGEIIMLKGFANNNRRVVTLLPTQSQTVNFEFLNCMDGDGNHYAVVTIGSQTWMAENLKTTRNADGSAIPLIADNTAWIEIVSPAYCWLNNDPLTYRDVYGGLYNWFAVSAGNLCPSGWRAPSYNDWMILVNGLGGEYAAGGKLKETANLHWQAPNTGATNENGFTGLPGGIRSASNGNFYNMSSNGYWWTMSEYSAGSGFCFPMNYLDITIPSTIITKQSGSSVRCLK